MVPTRLLQSDELPADGHLPVRTEISERPDAVVVTGGTSFSPVNTVLEVGGAGEHAVRSATPARPIQHERRLNTANAVMMTSRNRRRERRDPVILPLLVTLASDLVVGQARRWAQSCLCARPVAGCDRLRWMKDSAGRVAVRLMFLLVMAGGLTDSEDEFPRRDQERVSRPSVRPARRVTLTCPLCAALGQEVSIVAEVDTTTRPTIVADLSGCPHARVFGEVGGLSLDQEQQLISAALDAWESRRA